jgi:hypothetical protein
MGTTQVFEGRDLIDQSTRLDIRDISEWDTMTQAAKAKAGVEDYGVPQAGNVLLSGMFAPAVEAIIHGFIFSYDSNQPLDYSPSGEPIFCTHSNVKNTPTMYAPMMDMRVKSGLEEDLFRIEDDLVMLGKRMEKKYGSLRIYYTPLFFGDKLKIVAKDYAPTNQPEELRDINIDRGYRVTETLTMLTEQQSETIGDDGESC